MLTTRQLSIPALLLVAIVTGATPVRADVLAADPLPSWNNTPIKQAILNFVARVTKPDSPDFVPPAERIATFDNDGTLWVEHPLYTQLTFAIDRVKALAPQHPEWKTTQPFQAVLENDWATVSSAGVQGLVELTMATHAGLSTSEFETIATDWLKSARHPRFDRPYTELVYQPMLELLALLRANDFKTYIVSGGGVEFMRPFTDRVYGIPREQVIGSTIKTSFELQDGKPVLVRLPAVDFIDDKAGKPINIEKIIGQRPIFAAGNSDGDYEMLQYTTIDNPHPSLGVLVHHTDADREYAYDRDTKIGRLDKALSEAPERGWIVVKMKDDWTTIFPE